MDNCFRFNGGLFNFGNSGSSFSITYSEDYISLPTAGDSNTLYITTDNNYQYYWNGSSYHLLTTPLDIAVVNNYSALPSVSTVSGKFYWVSNSQGTQWLPGSLGGTYYPKGLYYSNGTNWEFVETPYQATQSEVNAGSNNDKFVTSLTLKNSTQWSSKVDAVAGKQLSTEDYTTVEKNKLASITEIFTPALKNSYDSSVTWISTNGTNLLNHLSNTSNPHGTTKLQVGLGNVDDTSDLNKPISTATQTALNKKADSIPNAVITHPTTAVETVVASWELSANTLTLGDSFGIKIGYQSGSTGTVIWRIRIGANRTTADTQVTILNTSAAQLTNAYGFFEGTVMVDTHTTMQGNGRAQHQASVLGTITGAIVKATINPDNPVFISVTAVVSVANAGNKITSAYLGKN